MSRYSDAWIVSQNSLESFAHFGSSICDDHLAGMQGVSNSNAATMVE